MITRSHRQARNHSLQVIPSRTRPITTKRTCQRSSPYSISSVSMLHQSNTFHMTLWHSVVQRSTLLTSHLLVQWFHSQLVFASSSASKKRSSIPTKCTTITTFCTHSAQFFCFPQSPQSSMHHTSPCNCLNFPFLHSLYTTLAGILRWRDIWEGRLIHHQLQKHIDVRINGQYFFLPAELSLVSSLPQEEPIYLFKRLLHIIHSAIITLIPTVLSLCIHHPPSLPSHFTIYRSRNYSTRRGRQAYHHFIFSYLSHSFLFYFSIYTTFFHPSSLVDYVGALRGGFQFSGDRTNLTVFISFAHCLIFHISISSCYSNPRTYNCSVSLPPSRNGLKGLHHFLRTEISFTTNYKGSQNCLKPLMCELNFISHGGVLYAATARDDRDTSWRPMRLVSWRVPSHRRPWTSWIVLQIWREVVVK